MQELIQFDRVRSISQQEPASQQPSPLKNALSELNINIFRLSAYLVHSLDQLLKLSFFKLRENYDLYYSASKTETQQGNPIHLYYINQFSLQEIHSYVQQDYWNDLMSIKEYDALTQVILNNNGRGELIQTIVDRTKHFTAEYVNQLISIYYKENSKELLKTLSQQSFNSEHFWDNKGVVLLNLIKTTFCSLFLVYKHLDSIIKKLSTQEGQHTLASYLTK